MTDETTLVVTTDETTLVVTDTSVEIIEVGIQGPPGKDAVQTFYTHNQTTPSALWVVNHNLGHQPVIGVNSVGGMQMIAEVLHQSPNQVLVYFDSPTMGAVTCI